jgi:Nucleotidyl transferase AbiEii toxin, Type IV TA system/Phage derived protein Gp49-like (DUF891)
MADFFELSNRERLEALNAAASYSGRPPHLLEKDIWVVWSLRHLFNGPYASNLVFKGGTSLSKAYSVIRRFSEDVDLTYDIRAIAGDLVGHAGSPLPVSKSQEKKWSKEYAGIWCPLYLLDWRRKPLAGVLVVVGDSGGGTFRAVYTVKFNDSIYVLHCFQKKSTSGIATPKPDLELIKERFKRAQAHANGEAN